MLILVVINLACKSNHINKTLEKLSEKQIFYLTNCLPEATCSLGIVSIVFIPFIF